MIRPAVLPGSSGSVGGRGVIETSYPCSAPLAVGTTTASSAAMAKWRFVERRVQTDLVGDVSRHLRRPPTTNSPIPEYPLENPHPLLGRPVHSAPGGRALLGGMRERARPSLEALVSSSAAPTSRSDVLRGSGRTGSRAARGCRRGAAPDRRPSGRRRALSPRSGGSCHRRGGTR